MAERSVVHSTFVLERNYPVTPERVFGAFADPGKKRRWFVESDHNVVEHHELDFQVGGKEAARSHFKEGTPLQGIVCVNETRYQDIVANRRLVFSSTMAIGGRHISASLVTVELLPAGAGTDVILTHQAAFFEGSDGPEMREAGWRKILERLGGELAR